MKKLITFISLSAIAVTATAQSVWGMEQCMAYAAEHASTVKQARWDLSSANVDRNEALADFFPSISAQVGAQYNWGRNIDPETNTYNDVTTFNNGYGIYASLTLWDGGQTLNRYRRARVERERQLNAIDMNADDSAISAMMAYSDAVYYLHSIKIAEDKLRQSKGMLDLTSRQEELGIKGRPDVAQAEATVANDEYELVHRQNLYTQAMLKLRSVMNMPAQEIFAIDTVSIEVSMPDKTDEADNIYNIALNSNPRAIDAKMMVKSSRYAYKVAKGTLSPTLSINAGISTSYYKNVSGGYEAPKFGEQFRNNRGEYVSATLSIPIFSGLSRLSTVKRAKYALEKAKEQQSLQQRQLHDDISAAVMDRDGYALEIISLQSKTDADEEALRLNTRKYEEGLISLIDLQISANTYYSSKLALLQKKMLYILKDKLVEYYKCNRLF